MSCEIRMKEIHPSVNRNGKQTLKNCEHHITNFGTAQNINIILYNTRGYTPCTHADLINAAHLFLIWRTHLHKLSPQGAWNII